MTVQPSASHCYHSWNVFVHTQYVQVFSLVLSLVFTAVFPGPGDGAPLAPQVCSRCGLSEPAGHVDAHTGNTGAQDTTITQYLFNIQRVC